MRPPAVRTLAYGVLVVLLTACADAAPGSLPLTNEPDTEPDDGAISPPGPVLAAGETREVVLRSLTFDVQGFERTLRLADLREVARPILDDVWLMDLDLTGFVNNALAQIAATPPESFPDTAARNLHRLLTMTPNNVALAGTTLDPLVQLSRSIGIAPQDAVADLMQAVDGNAPVIPTDIAAEVMLTELIATHPNAQFRRAPDGALLPIAARSIPVRLGDVVDNFARLAQTFGPIELGDGRVHPGIIDAASGFAVVEDAFAMTVKVDANALPYKGVDLDRASVASVNSLGGQIDHVFPLDDPEWLKISGLVPDPFISRVTVQIREAPVFYPPGDAREPAPYGNSGVWQAEPWLIEPMITTMAYQLAARMTTDCVVYEVASGAEVFRACMDDTKWVTFETFNNVGMPPAPKYIWDMIGEMAQVRLHDQNLPEGTANAMLTLSNLSLGVTSESLTEQIRANIAANPAALRELAEATNQNTRGEADFYYHRPPGLDEDWLAFIDPSDIPRDASGSRVRPDTYARPGFFADEALTRALAAPVARGGGVAHLEMRIAPGLVFFCQDAQGGVFRVTVREKPSEQRVRLAVTRLR